jgi:hypothetical protein
MYLYERTQLKNERLTASRDNLKRNFDRLYFMNQDKLVLVTGFEISTGRGSLLQMSFQTR